MKNRYLFILSAVSFGLSPIQSFGDENRNVDYKQKYLETKKRCGEYIRRNINFHKINSGLAEELAATKKENTLLRLKINLADDALIHQRVSVDDIFKDYVENTPADEVKRALESMAEEARLEKSVKALNQMKTLARAVQDFESDRDLYPETLEELTEFTGGGLKEALRPIAGFQKIVYRGKKLGSSSAAKSSDILAYSINTNGPEAAVLMADLGVKPVDQKDLKKAL